MKKIVILAIISLFCATGCNTVKKSTSEKAETAVRETNQRLIIFYDSTINIQNLLQKIAEYDAEIIYEYKTMKGYAVKIPDGKPLDEAISYFQNIEGVLQVNEDGVMQLHQPQNVIDN